jgi:hypothetical protein
MRTECREFGYKKSPIKVTNQMVYWNQMTRSPPAKEAAASKARRYSCPHVHCHISENMAL